MTKITIGIQARSTSSRFPNKVGEFIGKKTMLEHVVDLCLRSSTYINNWGTKQLMVGVALLIPSGDPIKKEFQERVPIIEGPEDDVLMRYVLAAKKFDSDYMVRITSDCPLLPQFLISKLITIAVMNRYGYISNVDERFRTTLDGWDVEVMSRECLDFLDRYAKTKADREHVTPFIRRNPVSEMNQGTVINFLDTSHMKLSVDTEMDLEIVRAYHKNLEEKYKGAISVFGRNQVHRI